MGYLFRHKRIGYDNIAVGSETGQERHVAGGAGYAANATSVVAERLITTDLGTSGQTSIGELLVKRGVSDDNFNIAGHTGPDVSHTGAASDTTNTSGFTSGTTFVTDVFPEIP